MDVELACRSGAGSGLDAEVRRRPTSVNEALEVLERVTDWLYERGDQRAAFPDIYAIITRRVAESVALGRGAYFLEPQWISRLAGRFCERYLESLRWSLEGKPQDTSAWRVAYGCCALGDMLPVNHVMLGLSAHINYDLPVGIAANIADLGGAGDPDKIARYKHDHDAVNHLLRAAVPEAFDHLVDKHRCPASRLLYRHAYASSEWIAMQLLSTWRERVWGQAMDLLAARTPAETRSAMDRIDMRARHYARLLAVPGVMPIATAEGSGGDRTPSRDAHSAKTRTAQFFQAIA